MNKIAKNLLILVLAIGSAGAMQRENGQATGNGSNNAELLEKSPKKAKSNDDNDVERRLIQAIRNIDLETLHTILQLPEVESLNSDDKSKLFYFVRDRLKEVKQIAAAAGKLRENVTDHALIQKLSYEGELKKLKTIEELLRVFICFENLQFPQVLFSAPRDRLSISLDLPLEALIMAEKEQIRACCYHLTRYNIARALVDKKREGIKVDLVTNRNQGENNPVLHSLKHIVENGISVCAPHSIPYEMNHHKFFIFSNNILNKKLVWTGSYNPTGYANNNAWDDVTISDDGRTNQQYINRFNEVKLSSKPIMIQDLNGISSRPSEYSLKSNNVPQELWNK